MIRLFINKKIKINSLLELDKKQSHYLLKVMRLKIGDNILIFNNLEGEFRAEIKNIEKNLCFLITLKKTKEFYPSSNLSLIYAPVKNVKNEFIITKATELGVTKILPAITNRTIVKKTNTEKLELCAIEASEQCGRVDVAQIREISSLLSLIKTLNKNDVILFADEKLDPSNSYDFSKLKKEKNKEIYILIGPEGGFSDTERDYISKLKNTYSFSLGKRILRADTAIIASLSLCINYLEL